MDSAQVTPGSAGGTPRTPTKRTNWTPTSPSPLRHSFTRPTPDEDDGEDDDEGTSPP
jgi:hypothetical protein